MNTDYESISLLRDGFTFANQRYYTVWACHEKKSFSTLGRLEFYPPWQQWVFVARVDAVFSASCMRDITDFMGQLAKEGKVSA